MSLAMRARPVFAALVLACAMMLAACAQQDAGPPSDPRDVIELRWVKAYPRESRSDVETGLLWGLSLAGATLPKGARVVGWRGDRITLDLARARVLDGTLPAWREFIAAMKDSGEYRMQGALDAGRFMAIMLGDPDRYYALTGATPTSLSPGTGWPACRTPCCWGRRPSRRPPRWVDWISRPI